MMPKITRGAAAVALVITASGCGGSGIDPGNGSATNSGGDTSGEMFEPDMRNVGPMGTGDVGGGANMIDTDVPSYDAGAGATGTVGGNKSVGGTTSG